MKKGKFIIRSAVIKTDIKKMLDYLNQYKQQEGYIRNDKYGVGKTGLSQKEYSDLHRWIKKILGKAKYCSIDITHKTPTVYQWANISGEYKWDINDFKSLCPKCHRRLDSGNLMDEEVARLNYE